MSAEDQRLEDQVAFGAQAEQFLRGPIGQYLLDRSAEQIEQAKESLAAVDPEDVRQISRLQAVIARNRDIEGWLGEIIQAGWDARNILAGEEL